MLKSFPFILLAACVFGQEGLTTINPDSRFMVVRYNRSVIFHGVNVVYKVDPYIPNQDSFDP